MFGGRAHKIYGDKIARQTYTPGICLAPRAQGMFAWRLRRQESGRPDAIGGGSGTGDHGNARGYGGARLDRPRPYRCGGADLCRALGHFQLKLDLSATHTPKAHASRKGTGSCSSIRKLQNEHGTYRHPRTSPQGVARDYWHLGHRRVDWAEPTKRNRSLPSRPPSSGHHLVDTAPVYGFGRSERDRWQAIAESRLLSTCLLPPRRLQWEGGRVSRMQSRPHMREVMRFFRRLRTDHIDIYQVHGPDPLITIEETADAMHTLSRKGKSAPRSEQFSVVQMERFAARPLHVRSRRTICSNAASRRPSTLCQKNGIAMLGYGALCRACCPDECGRTRFSMAMI